MSAERVSRNRKIVAIIAAVLLTVVSTVQAVTTLTPDVARHLADRAHPVRGLVAPAPAPRQEAQSSKSARTTTATVQTDRTDYPPDAQVNVTGSGWQPGETVELTVTEVETTPPGGFTDGPFTYYTSSDEQGSIANSDFHTDQNDIGVTFRLSAKGLSSGLTAQTTFRDSSYAAFFQLDGDTATRVTDPPSHDWSQVYSDITKGTVNASGSSAINFFTDAFPGGSVATEDAFSGGNSKDVFDMSQWTYDNSPPQNKANLENAIAAAYLDPNNGNHTYLYVATNRYDNSGSMAVGVWFLQTPIGTSGGRFYTLNADGTVNTSSPAHHVDGDLLLVANFTSGVATITSFTWSNGTIPATGTTLSSTIGNAVVNTVPLDGASNHPAAVPWPVKSSAKGNAANFVQDGEFFEAGVDLNLLFPNQTNFNFSSFVVETRASTSPTATLSDFIVGHVSTAPDVQVTKTADNASVDAGSQIGFTVTVQNVGPGDLLNVTLTDNSDSTGTAMPLPAGAGNDIVWSIDAPNSSNKFILNGTTAGSQSLSLAPGTTLLNNSAAISVHIVGTSTSNDVSATPLTNRATVAASNEAAAFSGNNQAVATITIGNSGVSTISPQNAVEGASTSFKMGSFTSVGTGPATLTINWGDGSPNTVVTFTAGGLVMFGDQSHTYAEEGSKTVTETVTLGGVIKSGTFTVDVSDPAIVASGVDTITKAYTGQAVGSQQLATFTDPGGAESNIATDYSATVDWGTGYGTSPATITFSGAAGSKTDKFTVTASVPYTNVGDYSPTVTITHEGSAPQTVHDAVTITAIPLTISADAVPGTAANDAFSKTYDGQVYSGFTVRYDGFVNGETVAALGGALSFSGTATAAKNVGSYTVTPGGQTSSNYTITFVNGTLNINQAPLTITADAVPGTAANDQFTKSYDGQPYTGFTVRYDGFVNGETSSVLGGTLGFSGTGTTAVNAGGPFTVTPAGLTSNNYNITFANGTVMINQVALSITADADVNTAQIDGFSKTYNGQTGYTPFTVRYSGFVNNETPAVLGGTLAFSGSGTTAKNVGSYTVTPGGLTSGNYHITFIDGSLTITQVPLTITADSVPATVANDAFSKVYDGKVYSGFTVRYDGFVNGEDSGVLSGTLTFSGPGTTAVNAGGPYGVTPAGLTSGNYAISFADGSLDIIKAVLSVAVNNASFDEGIAPSGLTISMTGFVNNENSGTAGVTGSAGIDASSVSATSAPGSYQNVTVNVSGLSAQNYSFSAVNTATITVVDVAPAIVMSTGTITLSAGDGFTRPGSFTDPGIVVLPKETWTLTVNYGDGTPVSGPADIVPGAISLSHSYTDAGTYTVTMTIADNYGASSTKTFTVIVKAPPTLAVSHNGSAVGATASGQTNVSFAISGAFTESTASGSYTINWSDPAGDGSGNANVQTGPVSGASGSFNGSHSYAHGGTYKVSVTMTDANGDAKTVQFDLTVS